MKEANFEVLVCDVVSSLQWSPSDTWKVLTSNGKTCIPDHDFAAVERFIVHICIECLEDQSILRGAVSCQSSAREVIFLDAFGFSDLRA
jgi:hypothetical protein